MVMRTICLDTFSKCIFILFWEIGGKKLKNNLCLYFEI